MHILLIIQTTQPQSGQPTIFFLFFQSTFVDAEIFCFLPSMGQTAKTLNPSFVGLIFQTPEVFVVVALSVKNCISKPRKAPPEQQKTLHKCFHMIRLINRPNCFYKNKCCKPGSQLSTTVLFVYLIYRMNSPLHFIGPPLQ